MQKPSLGLSLSLRLAQQCYTRARPYYPSDVGQARAVSLSRFRNPHRLTSVQTIPNGCLYSSQSCQLNLRDILYETSVPISKLSDHRQRQPIEAGLAQAVCGDVLIWQSSVL